MADVVIRAALTDEDSIEAHRFLMRHGAEIALAPINPVKVMEMIYGLVTAEVGAALLLAHRDRELVGVLGLAQTPFWYSDESYIVDRIFYVAPDHRGETGPALLRAARDIADQAGQILMLAQTNPNRHRQRVLLFYPR